MMANAPVETIGVVFANLSPLFSDLAEAALAQQQDLAHIGSAHSSSELSVLLRDTRARVILVGTKEDKERPAAASLLKYARSVAPAIRSVVIGNELRQIDVVAYLRAGARGLLTASDTSISVLLKCLRCVSTGQVWATSEQLDLLLNSLNTVPSFHVTNVCGQSILSRREDQVLLLLAEGLSNRELAESLNLSEHTIKNHLFRIFDKLGVSSRVEAVLYVMSQRDRCEHNMPDIGSVSLPQQQPVLLH